MESSTRSKPVTRSARMMTDKRVLVVDDEAIVCQVVEGFLAHGGWSVQYTYDTDSALQMHLEKPYPVVMLDVHMPSSSTALLEQIRVRTPLTQVIMFTGDPSVASARDAVKLGAFDYLLKPLKHDELTRVVDLAFDRHNLVSEREQLRIENAEYRKQLEQRLESKTDQLRQSELRYRKIFDHAADPIFLIDLDSREICDYNFSARRFLGLTTGDEELPPLSSILGDQLGMCFHEARQNGRGEWRLQRVAFRTRDLGTRHGQVAANRVELDGKIYLQVVVRDVTEQLELQERAELMELELMSEQRLANIGLLASGVAHNINTPLMGIYGLAQVIKMKHPDVEDIDGVLAQVERINGIIRNLMWKSRQENQQTVQEIDLNVLLEEELRFLEADLEFKHNIAKDVRLSDRVPPIMGRYGDFSQSIVNVIRNAIDAMHVSEKKEFSLSTAVVGDDIVIKIADTGCGIPEENRDRVFEPFFSTKPLQRQTDDESEEPTGTGLGLSTAHKLLSAYNCRITVDSEVGKGTTFRIYIPVSANAIPREAPDSTGESTP